MLSQNRRQVKHQALVLFVCLCLQMSGVSAPFVHLHADAAHETDHHDGRVIHRHLAAHATADAHHHDGPDSTKRETTEEASSVEAAAGLTSLAPSATSVRLSLSGGHLAPPEGTVVLIARPAPLMPPPDDVGDRLFSPPGVTPSSLRGPPR